MKKTLTAFGRWLRVDRHRYCFEVGVLAFDALVWSIVGWTAISILTAVSVVVLVVVEVLNWRAKKELQRLRAERDHLRATLPHFGDAYDKITRPQTTDERGIRE